MPGHAGEELQPPAPVWDQITDNSKKVAAHVSPGMVRHLFITTPMKITRLLFPLLSVLFLAAPATIKAADTYKIDPVHSSVLFKVKHLGVSYVHGRFNDISGTVVLDKENAGKGSIDAAVKTESVDTHVAARDRNLRSPDFLDVKQFPEMTFKSKEVKKSGDDTFEVTGDFTLHGVTKPLTVKLTKIGEGKGMEDEYRAGGETQFTIKRSDFGMTYMLPGVGDEITVILSLEGIRQ
jgi:polyisoprenoid-binding protein YceI